MSSPGIIQTTWNQSSPALSLLEQVIRSQASLVARWQGVGFIHGVMNTDNMLLSGETIDYGPCAFMDSYDSAAPSIAPSTTAGVTPIVINPP